MSLIRSLCILGAAGALTLVLYGCGGAEAAQSPPTVTVVSLLDIVPDAYVAQNEERAQALFTSYVPSVNVEPGLVSIQVWRETERGNHFSMVETWASVGDFDRHSTMANTKAFRAALQPLLGSPFDQRVVQ